MAFLIYLTSLCAQFAEQMHPFLLNFTAGVLVLLVSLQILSFALHYLNIKNLLPVGVCIFNMRIIIVLIGLLGLIFYARLFTWGFIDSPLTLSILLITLSFNGWACRFDSKATLLCLITGSILLVIHFLLRLPIVTMTGICYISIGYFIFSVMVSYEEGKTKILQWLNWLAIPISLVLNDLDLLPKSAKTEVRDAAIQIHSIAATTFYFTLPYWTGLLFLYGSLALIFNILVLIVLNNQSRKTKYFVFAPVQIIKTSFDVCRSIAIDYDSRDYFTYKYLFFSLVGFVFLFFIGYLSSLQPRAEINTSDLPTETNVSEKKGQR